MRCRPAIRKRQSRSRLSGLTLLEILVSSALLVVIVFGLTAMFGQTQRAFRGGLRQVDVLGGSRFALEMIARDLQQLTPSRSDRDFSFYSGLMADTWLEVALPGQTGPGRRLFLKRAFMLNRTTNWQGIGYAVLNPDNLDEKGIVVGTLYRYTTNATWLEGNRMFDTFDLDKNRLYNDRLLSPVLDGVVHFHLSVYDTTGERIFGSTNDFIQVANDYAGEKRIAFSGPEVPAFVEVELGIIEPQVLEKIKAMDPVVARAFLERQAGKIHFFRQQIPIRSAIR
jgi:hypothetical protein